MKFQRIGIVLSLAVSLLMFGSVKTFATDVNFKDRVINLTTRPYTDIQVSIPPSTDAADDIQQALNQAAVLKQPIKVVLPRGEYHLTHHLVVYGNTYIQAYPDTKLIREHSGVFVQNGNSGDTNGGYTGNSNIVVDGGVWDANADQIPQGGSAFSFAHAQNLLFQNLTVKDVSYGHAIDLSGDTNVVVRNSNFLGFYDPFANTPESRWYSEAIQIDIVSSTATFPSFGPYDYTQTTNVLVESCKFDTSDTHGMSSWGRGVGGHNSTFEKQYTNITIRNNVFNHNLSSGIRVYDWSDVTIQNNIFANAPYGVIVKTSAPGADTKDVNGIQHNPEPLKGIEIKNNTFYRMSEKANLVTGDPSAHISNVNIANNNFNAVSSRNYYSLSYVDNVNKSGNFQKDISKVPAVADLQPYKVLVPNTAFWQAKGLVVGFEGRGYQAEGINVWQYRGGQTPKESDPYRFVIYTDLGHARGLVVELQRSGYPRSYGEAE